MTATFTFTDADGVDHEFSLSDVLFAIGQTDLDPDEGARIAEQALRAVPPSQALAADEVRDVLTALDERDLDGHLLPIMREDDWFTDDLNRAEQRGADATWDDYREEGGVLCYRSSVWEHEISRQLDRAGIRVWDTFEVRTLDDQPVGTALVLDEFDVSHYTRGAA